MPQACRVCRHERRHEIELGLVARIAMPTLAGRYGVSIHSLKRHSSNHLTGQLRAALALNLAPSDVDLERLSRSESESLLGNLVHQRARLSAYAEACVAAGDYKAAIAAEGRITECLTLTSRLLGQIVSRHQVTQVHVTLTPGYLQFRSILLDELRDHPDLAARIARRVREIEASAAETITDRGQPVTIEHQPMESTR